jgi:predicted ester cyclase
MAGRWRGRGRQAGMSRPAWSETKREVPVVAAESATAVQQSSEEAVRRNKEIVRLVTEKGFNEGDLAGLGRYFAADYEVHAPGVPPLPPGPEAFRMAVMLWRQAFPDISVTVEDVVGEGEKVYCRFTTRGTHTGPLLGMPPSGKRITIHEMSCHRLSGGVVVESWIGDNVPNILHQIGALVPSEGAPPI